MLVFWISALALSPETKAGVSVIQEVRRQFQSDPGNLKCTSRPDYVRSVNTVTIGPLKATVAAGLPVGDALVDGLPTEQLVSRQRAAPAPASPCSAA